jgi:hypothetical protein
MDSIKKQTGNDFSIIFDEIEKFHDENPSYKFNFISEEDMNHDKSIREFTNICQEINSSPNTSVIYTTFS